VPLPPSQRRRSWVPLNEAYHRAAANLSTNPDVRIEQVNGQDRLTLTGLDKLDEPSSLIALRGQIDSLLPRTDLTDAILEINIKST
jgi:hypothetical protein